MELIYIVDDYDMNLFILEEYLNNDYTVVKFKKAQDCIVHLKRTHAKVVLMDCKMPEMDGYRATEQIKERFNNVTVIGITGNSYGEGLDKCYKSGMSHVVVKPIVQKKLLKIIKEYY